MKLEKRENVVDVKAWKRDNESRREENSVKSYLERLNFHDLIQEGHGIVESLGKSNLDNDLYLKSKYFMKEIDKRLLESNDGFAEVLKELKEQTDRKIGGLGLGLI